MVTAEAYMFQGQRRTSLVLYPTTQKQLIKCSYPVALPSVKFSSTSPDAQGEQWTRILVL